MRSTDAQVIDYQELAQSLEEKNRRLEQDNKRLLARLRTDALTGLLNYEGLCVKLDEEIAYTLEAGTALSLVVFDLDHFKKINDLCGHPKGNDVLKNLPDIVKKMIRETDVCARYGGEEFVIILPHTTLAETKIMMERLRVEIAENLREKAQCTMDITASFGIAEYRPGEGPEACLSRADVALYDAKHRGRNCVVLAQTMQ